MKKIGFCLLALLLTLLTTNVAHTQEKRFEVLVGGGIDSPVRPDEFSDNFNLGFTGKIAAGYFLTKHFALGANLSYNRFGLDKGFILNQQGAPIGSGIEIQGGNLSIFEFAGVGKYYFMAPARTANIYILGGPGFAVSRISDFTISAPGFPVETVDGDTQTDLMMTGGIGVMYNLNSRWGLFVEGRYSHVLTEGDNISYLPVRIGVVF